MTPAEPTTLSEAMEPLDILLVCGSGGVGKTSVAASIAVYEALQGRHVCVLTIDPARRLAQAMGLDALDDREREVDLSALAGPNAGKLTAIMLDAKKAFDRLITESAPDTESAEKVLNNRVYQHLSQSTSGVQEYMALERLYELTRSTRFDLLVVDTPPASHARDLLEGPEKMLRFLTGRSLRWFLRPGAKVGRFGLRAIGGAGGAIVGLVQRVTGAEMLRDTMEFFENFEGMYDTFVDRVAVVERMFGDQHTGFLVVASPERESIDEAVSFEELLADNDFAYIGAVVNRVEPRSSGGAVGPADLIEAGLSEDLAGRVATIHKEHIALARRDRKRAEELAERTASMTITVPRMIELPSELEGLARLADHLYE